MTETAERTEEAKGKGQGQEALEGIVLDSPSRRGDARAPAREEEANDHHAHDPLPDTDGDENAEVAHEADDVETLVDLWMDRGKDTVRGLWEWFGRDSGLGREHPAALVDLFRYWKSAPMAGSFPPLRLVQRVDGFTVGLMFTLFGYAVAWLGQRPLRRACFALFIYTIWRFKS